MKIEYFIKKDYMTSDQFPGINFVKNDYITTDQILGNNVVSNEFLNQKAIVILENKQYTETLTATDIVEYSHNLIVDWMPENQQITVDYSVCETLKIMKNKATDVLPVYKANNFYGLIYKNDLLEYLTEYTNDLNSKVDKKTNELQELIATKNQFFSIIAHDLQSPFNTILGFSKLLEKNAKNYTPEKIEKLAKYIKDVSEQTYELLVNLLEWSKSQQNKIIFSPETVNLKELIDKKITTFEKSAENKEIKLFHTISNSVSVSADINMLKTILRNLITIVR